MREHVRRVLCGAGVCVALLASGCVHVQPYERADLATLDEHEELESSGSSYEAHFWSVREGAAGGTGEAGGGCGCN